MKTNVSRILAAGAVFAAALVGLTSQTPSSAAPNDFCTVDSTTPCIQLATLNGGNIAQSDIIVDTYSDPTEALHNTGFTVLGLDSGDVGATIKVVMNTGSIKPRVISMTGEYVFTDRYQILGDWYVEVEMLAVEILESCDNPTEPYCPTTADPEDVQVQAQGNINDADWYPADPDALHGLDQFSNINLFWYPPTIATSSTGAVTIDFLMENSHYYPDGVTEFQGFTNVRLPNRVLREFYGIPNPETMVDGSFTATAGTGTVSSYQETGADAWRIDATGITFSKRHLRMTRGVIVPTRPTSVEGVRTGDTRAKLTFVASEPRGAKVTGYQARCVSGGGDVVTKLRTEPIASVTVGGLKDNVRYDCRVRAKSKAGYGPFSAAVSIPRNP